MLRFFFLIDNKIQNDGAAKKIIFLLHSITASSTMPADADGPGWQNKMLVCEYI